MKKYNFSMQKVLDYKENVQNNEMNILSDMRNEQHLLEDELYFLYKILDYNKQKFEQKCKDGMLIHEITKDMAYLKELQLNINQKKCEIEKKEMQIEAQINKLTIIKTEKGSIERLKDKELESYKALEQKAHEIFVDEFVINSAQKLI